MYDDEYERKRLDKAMAEAITGAIYDLITTYDFLKEQYTIKDFSRRVWQRYEREEEDIQTDYCDCCVNQHDHIQKCLTCRRNRNMKDNFAERNMEE